jgi:hypothetical protein
MNEFFTFANGLPNGYGNGHNDAIEGSNYGVFHLHRLDYNQLSASGHVLANRNL